MALTKTLSTGQGTIFSDGDTICYDINVYNQGEYDAHNIEVVDYFPSSLTLTSTGFTVVGDKAYRTIAGPISPGDSTSVNICFQINPRFSGRIDNFAEISKVEDPFGNPLSDIDSRADDLNDETNILDDALSSLLGDEDDHDIHTIIVSFSGICSGSAVDIFYQAGVDNANESLGLSDGAVAELRDLADTLVLDLGVLLDSGSMTSLIWRKSLTTGGDPVIEVQFSADANIWMDVMGTPFTLTSTSFITTQLETDTIIRYVRFINQSQFDLELDACLLYTSPSPRDQRGSRMPSSA